MPQSLAAIHLHVIFSTKMRQPIITPDLAPRLHAYMGGVIRQLDCVPHTINGMDDHVHLLISVAPKISVSDLIGRTKSNSSRWVHDLDPKHSDFGWQRGYGAFSVSESSMNEVGRYVSEQPLHHARMTFQEEFVAFLSRHQLKYDPQYVWD